MKKMPAFFLVGVTLVALSFALVAGSQSVVAQTASPLTTNSPQASPAPGMTVVSSANGPHFFAGESIVLDQDLTGDVYVTGGMVMINGKIDGDLLVAAVQLILNGEVTEDLRVAAGDTKINGQVGDDITIATGTVTLDRQSTVSGSVIIGAGTANLYGTVNGQTWIASSQANLGGYFKSQVQVMGEKAALLPGAIVVGDLFTKLEGQPEIADTAQIQGQRQFEVKANQDARDQAGKTLVAGVFLGVSLVWLVTWLAMGIIAGGLLIILLPGVTKTISQTVTVSPLVSLGWGVVHLILTPIVAIVLMVTVIGFPIGIILLLLWVLSLIVSTWITAYALGQKIIRSSDQTSCWRRILQFSVGLVILEVVSLIPIVGWLVKAIAVLLGMGLLVTWLKNRRSGEMVEVIQVDETRILRKPQVMVQTKPGKAARKIRSAIVAKRRTYKPRNPKK